MPACIAPEAKADVKRFTLCSLAASFYQLPSTAEELVADRGFWATFKDSIADSLNEVELYEVIVENVAVLDELLPTTAARRLTNATAQPRLWIAFKVRAKNHTNVGYYLSTQQALTKARLQSSLQTRIPGTQVASLVLAPPRLAIQYASVTTIVEAAEELQFVDRLLSTEDQDAATVLLGCIVGIFFGLAALALVCRGNCVFFRRRTKEEHWNNNVNPQGSPRASPLSPATATPDYDDTISNSGPDVRDPDYDIAFRGGSPRSVDSPPTSLSGSDPGDDKRGCTLQ
jgi:hypothetical protein